MFRTLRNNFDKTQTRAFLGNLLITSLSKWLDNEPAIFSDSRVLSNVMTALPHLNPMKSLPSIRAFLCTIGSQIEVENLPATPLQRKHDQFLMDIALDLYSKLTDLQHLNAFRLHLQVTLLSDITTADSKFIRSEIMQSHRALSNSAEELFPYQPSPDTAGWNIWQAFLLHLTRAPAYSLIQPLGRWLHHSHALLRK